MDRGENNIWDVFISHASEDKEKFVRPLANTLKKFGVSVWYDEFTLKPGDSLSRSLDKGLSKSKFGIVVISHNFTSKRWTEFELRSLVSREVNEDTVIIPIWLGVSHTDVSNFSPSLADKIAIKTEGLNAEDVALQALRSVRPDIYNNTERENLKRKTDNTVILKLEKELKIAKEILKKTKNKLSEFQCPICQSSIVSIFNAPTYPDEDCWGIREIYACGYACMEGVTERLCPSDPDFPTFNDYELAFTQKPNKSWKCFALPKTENSRLIKLHVGHGTSKDQAREEVYKSYLNYESWRNME